MLSQLCARFYIKKVIVLTQDNKSIIPYFFPASSLYLPLKILSQVLTCQPLFEIDHFLWLIKVAPHLNQDIHIFNHQFLIEEKEVRWAIKITFRWEL